MKIKRSYISKTVAGCFLLVSSGWAFTQSLAPKDPGVRGGPANTGGGLQQRGIPIPHPPLISPNPKTGATVSVNERHMGANLADNIIQGQAGPDEFRTTPLWGVGQRIFFLHDGRTSDLLEAILAHFSPPSAPDPRHHDPAYPASEANGVIRNFKELSIHDKQSVLDFLRSL